MDTSLFPRDLFAELDRLNAHVEGDVLVIEGDMGLEMPKDMEATHVEVNLPRPRTFAMTSSERFGVLKERIWQHIRSAERP